VAATARESGAAELAAELKIAKYSGSEDKCILRIANYILLVVTVIVVKIPRFKSKS